MDPAGAPRLMGWTFTFEKGIGIKFRDDHRGCSLWRLGDSDFGRAWTDADTDWDVER